MYVCNIYMCICIYTHKFDKYQIWCTGIDTYLIYSKCLCKYVCKWKICTHMVFVYTYLNVDEYYILFTQNMSMCGCLYICVQVYVYVCVCLYMHTRAWKACYK